MQGWRLVYLVLAGLAGMTTALLYIFGLEPRTASRNVRLSGKTGQGLRGRKSVKFYASLFSHIYSGIKVCPLPEGCRCILSR